MCSRGSVIPLFKKQLKNGGPITLTDEDMTRFIMNIYQASKLILQAGMLSQGGEIFILKMPAFKLSDLVDAMIEFYAPVYGYDPEEIEFNKHFLKQYFKLSGELGKELLKAYPKTLTIGNKLVYLTNISKKFLDQNEFYF